MIEKLKTKLSSDVLLLQVKCIELYSAAGKYFNVITCVIEMFTFLKQELGNCNKIINMKLNGKIQEVVDLLRKVKISSVMPAPYSFTEITLNILYCRKT